MQRMDDGLGYYDAVNDQSFVMDCFGNLVWVPFTIGYFYFLEH